MQDHHLSSNAALMERPRVDNHRHVNGGTSETHSDTPVTPIQALSYGTLRMLSEGAAGIGNQAVAFSASDEGLTWAPATPGLKAEPGAVQVPAFQVGKYPLLAGVELAAPAEILSTPSINAVQAGGDALFWSDSAVQKFVFPYVASCGGVQASSLLATLQSAWNFYDTGAAPVYGLMHLAPAVGQQVGIDQQIALVVREGDELQAVPLGSFSSDKAFMEPTPLPDMAAYVASELPPPSSSYPGYRVLRAMAEWSGCITGNPQYFVWSAGTGQMMAPTDTPPPLLPGDMMIPAQTPTMPRTRHAPGSVTITPSDGNSVSLLDLADAVFWSSGSIQQFLLPYYASVCGFDAPQELQVIVDAWKLNQPGSGPNTIPDTRSPMMTLDTTGDVTVYALVHLPRSSWMTEEELAAMSSTQDDETRAFLASYRRRTRPRPGSALHGVGVLHRHAAPGSGVHLLPLGEFRALYPHHFG